MNRGLPSSKQKIYFVLSLILLLAPLLFYFSKTEARPRRSRFLLGDKTAEDRNQASRKVEEYFQQEAQRFYGLRARLRFRMDYRGRLWVVEENPSFGVKIVCLDENATPEVSWLAGLTFPPSAHSFNLSFTFANEPCLTWVESKDEDLLKILRPSQGQPLTLAAGPAFSITSPSVCADPAGTLWVFWSQAFQGVDRIFSCRVIGTWMRPAEMLFSCGRFPSVWPQAQTDFAGRIQLSWAAYDGHDYEIFLSSYDGTSWSVPQRITDNTSADLFPGFMSFLTGDVSLYWLESTKEESRVWFTRILGNTKEKPRLLWHGLPSVTSFELFESGNRLYLYLLIKGISWRWLPITDPDLLNSPTLQEEVREGLPLPLLPGRDDDVYIAFGDSITSGLIKTSLDPEKYYYSGYPQRLELLMKQEYGAGRVINEGFDGELTAQGLSRLPDELNDYKARYLLLMEGFNDVVFPNISIDSIIFNLSEMVRLSQQAGVIPFLATITPRRDSVWYQPLFRDRHLILNDRIRQLAPQMHIPLVDQYKAMESYPASDGGLLSLFSVDLKHPNEKGYQVIATTWFNEIKAFPFPPKNLSVSRRDFVWESNFVRLLEFPPLNQVQPVPELGIGNFLTWQVNPKIKEHSFIAGYHVYRKKSTETDSSYSLIATIKDKLHYFDKQVILSIPYSYLVSTFRTNGIEGPAAGPVSR